MKTKLKFRLLFLALLSLSGFAHGQGAAISYRIGGIPSSSEPLTSRIFISGKTALSMSGCARGQGSAISD